MALAPWFAVPLTLRCFTVFTISLACSSTILIPRSGNLFIAVTNASPYVTDWVKRERMPRDDDVC